MTQQAGIWTESFRVCSYEVTPHGHAALQSLCHYVQEAAANHARALGLSRDAMLAHDRAWVLMRLRLQVDRYPSWRDLVRVETWPSGIDGLFATREFVLYDADDAVLARGTSAWGVIDVKRRRPMRVPDDVYAITPPDRTRPLQFASRRVPALERANHARRFDVRFSDLDLNRHVNNVRYVEWALEAVPKAVLTAQYPVDLDITFRAEITFGATVVAQAQRLVKADGTAFLHAVRRAEDDEIAVQARTQWRKH